jgi:DnaJ C terminal domain
MTRKKTKALYALAMLGLFGCGLVVFILAADEQSILSSGLPAADKISLQELITQGSRRNKHIELANFYFGKTFIYTTELVQFNEVYVPMFPSGQPEDGRNLHVLLLIRNDRNSNEPLIQTRGELGRFVAEFDRDPRSVTGVLRKPSDRVRSLTAEAYPGTNGQSLQVLRARDFPTQGSANILWSVCVLCLVGAAACAVAYRRQRGSSEDIQIELVVTAIEASAGKEVRVVIPESHETITAKIPAGAQDGMRLRFKGKGRPGKGGERGDFYILLRVK